VGWLLHSGIQQVGRPKQIATIPVSKKIQRYSVNGKILETEDLTVSFDGFKG